MLSKEQKKFMVEKGIVNANQLDNIEEADIEEKISELLMLEGFEDDYRPNEVGLMCESILDNLE